MCYLQCYPLTPSFIPSVLQPPVPLDPIPETVLPGQGMLGTKWHFAAEGLMEVQRGLVRLGLRPGWTVCLVPSPIPFLCVATVVTGYVAGEGRRSGAVT